MSSFEERVFDKWWAGQQSITSFSPRNFGKLRANLNYYWLHLKIQDNQHRLIPYPFCTKWSEQTVVPLYKENFRISLLTTLQMFWGWSKCYFSKLIFLQSTTCAHLTFQMCALLNEIQPNENWNIGEEIQANENGPEQARKDQENGQNLKFHFLIEKWQSLGHLLKKKIENRENMFFTRIERFWVKNKTFSKRKFWIIQKVWKPRRPCFMIHWTSGAVFFRVSSPRLCLSISKKPFC